MKTMVAMIIAAMTASCIGKPIDPHCAKRGDTFEQVYMKCDGTNHFEKKIVNGKLHEVWFHNSSTIPWKNVSFEDLYVRFTPQERVEFSIFSKYENNVMTTELIR